MRLTNKLVAIADSIRLALGSSALMTIDEMPDNIADIEAEGDAMEDAFVERSASLTTYTNNRITTVGQHAMRGFPNLTTVIFDNVTTLQQNSFYGSNGITSVSIPKCTTIGREAFLRCSGLTEMALPEIEFIATNAFQDCTNLALLDLYSPNRTTIPTLQNAGALNGTAIAAGNGYIIINDEDVEDMKATSPWSTYASQIIGNSDRASVMATLSQLQAMPINRLEINDLDPLEIEDKQLGKE